MVPDHRLRKPSLPQRDSTIRLFGKTRNQGGFPNGSVLSKTREGFGRRLPPTAEFGIKGSLQKLGVENLLVKVFQCSGTEDDKNPHP